MDGERGNERMRDTRRDVGGMKEGDGGLDEARRESVWCGVSAVEVEF